MTPALRTALEAMVERLRTQAKLLRQGELGVQTQVFTVSDTNYAAAELIDAVLAAEPVERPIDFTGMQVIESLLVPPNVIYIAPVTLVRALKEAEREHPQD